MISYLPTIRPEKVLHVFLAAPHTIGEVNFMNKHDPKIFDTKEKKPLVEQPIPPKFYPVLDTDLARDNVENDLPAADREDLT